MRTRSRRAAAGEGPSPSGSALDNVRVRPLATVVVGFAGGIVVGLTSVGSGSLIIISLLALYPAIKANDLVGTDLVQAVPLVVSAAAAHLLFGDFRLDLTVAVLAGALPGVFLGAQLSSRLPGGLVRRALALVLLASGLKLLGVGNLAMVAVLGAVMLAGPLLWMWARRSHGLPALAFRESRSTVESEPPAAVR